jgi:hypothetical protein
MGFWRVSGAGVRRGVTAAVVLVLSLAVQACLPASASGPVTSRFFGMHAPNLETAFPDAPVGAVSLATNNVYWPALETSAGFDWTRIDALVAAARAGGAKPLVVLGLTPRIHSTRPGAANVAASVPRMKPWKAYVGKVVSRYGTRADYQIWPEPSIKENWAGTPQQLARLVVAAAKVIHNRARKAVVVGPGMVMRMRYQRKFMARFYAARVGGKRVGASLDAVGIDPYPVRRGTPEDSVALIRAARRIRAANKVSAPVWNVEITYGVAGAHEAVPSFTARKQASYVVRTHLLNAANRVKRVYWLGWAPISEVAIQLVKPDLVTPTAAGKAYATVARWMLHQRVRSCTRSAKTHVWTCTMTRAGQISHVYWIPSGKARIRAPKGARTVETMSGSTSATKAGRRLTVNNAPIWVHH